MRFIKEQLNDHLPAWVICGLVLPTIVAVLIGTGLAQAQDAPGQVNVFGQIHKAFMDPTRGVLKSYNVQWENEPLGNTDTFTSLNDFAGKAIDEVAYDGATNRMTFTHANGSTVAFQLAGGSGGGGVSGISGLEVNTSATDLTLVLQASQGNIPATFPAATAHSAGVMTAELFSKLGLIQAGAEPNVQADWNVTDRANDAYIWHKPVTFSPHNAGVPTNVLTRVADGYEWRPAHLVTANPAGEEGGVLTRLGIDGVNYNLQKGEQGPAGIYTVHIYIATLDEGRTPEKPTTSVTSEHPVGGSVTVATGAVVPPNGWHLTAGGAEQALATEDANTIWTAHYQVNPALQTGVITNPSWSAVYQAGAQGPPGPQGAPGTTLPAYAQTETEVLHSRAGALFWEGINEVPNTPGDASGVGHILTVTGQGDRDYAWREGGAVDQTARDRANANTAEVRTARAETAANRAIVERLDIFGQLQVSPPGIPDNTFPEWLAIDLDEKTDPRTITSIRVNLAGEVLTGLITPEGLAPFNRTFGAGGVINVTLRQTARSNLRANTPPNTQYIQGTISYSFSTGPDAIQYFNFGTNNNGFRTSGATGGDTRFEQALTSSPSIVRVGAHSVTFVVLSGTGGNTRLHSKTFKLSTLGSTAQTWVVSQGSASNPSNAADINLSLSYNATTRALTYALSTGITGVSIQAVLVEGRS